MTPPTPLTESAPIPPKLGARTLLLALMLGASGCASLSSAAPEMPALNPPSAFDTPWVAQGEPEALRRWWAQWQDPVLLRLIDEAQRVSPSVAAAQSRIAESRANRVAAAAALGPSLDASASASRGVSDPALAPRSSAQLALQAGWEIDLFGGVAAADEAARARLQGAQAQAHEARVSVAAEVAQQVLTWRHCRRSLALTEADTQSRTEVARLTHLRADAGFDSPASAALARASAAQGQADSTRQRAECDIALHGLAALTAQPLASLRAELTADTPPPADDRLSLPSSLPAQVLAQRPDVYAAARQVWATSADVRQAQAGERPRLSVSGSIGALSSRAGGVTSDGTVWSIGPLQLTLPLWDGGRRTALTGAAQARYSEAVLALQATARRATQEVETALVQLQTTAERLRQAEQAASGYQASFDATLARQRAGLGNLLELEDTRRSALAAQSALLALRHERALAWIGLYRAAGGGWQAPSD